MRFITQAAVLSATLGLLTGFVHAQSTKPALDLSTANQIVAGCQAKAAEMGWKMVVAVVDDGANLKALQRMDGAFLVSVAIAQDKAATSARAPVSSRQWGEFSKKIYGLDLVPGMVSFAGGLPIFMGGAHVGGVGVSGGTADQDEVCAQAGLEAAAAALK